VLLYFEHETLALWWLAISAAGYGLIAMNGVIRLEVEPGQQQRRAEPNFFPED
jgi:hypothetical protein